MNKKQVIRVIVIVVVLLVILLELIPTHTTEINDSKDSFSELQVRSIGGLPQTILIRTKDVKNPILIFLHGGPGFPIISYAKKFQNELENSFTVINWDQRGSGKSYTPFIDKNTMTEDQLLKDLDEIIDFACNKFQKNKVFLVGHSWGSVLGKDYVQRKSDKILAFISIGQVVDPIVNDQISYLRLLQGITNKKAKKELKKIGSPPYNDFSIKNITLRKWINYYGGNDVRVIPRNEIISGTFLQPEYNIVDFIRLLIGNYYSMMTLYPEMKQRNLCDENLEFKIPVYFIVGENDLVTNSELVFQYYEHINAPSKEFDIVKNAAHEICLDNKEYFVTKMQEIKKTVENIH
jgi:pimeloyl-ACP methyl ester carboxylesterase